MVSAVESWDYGANVNGTPTHETDYTYTRLDVQQVSFLSNGNQVGMTTYGYNSTPAKPPTSGIPQHGAQNAGGPYFQTISHVLTGGNPSVTTYGMDDTGQVVSTSDPNENPATTFTGSSPGLSAHRNLAATSTSTVRQVFYAQDGKLTDQDTALDRAMPLVPDSITIERNREQHG